MKERTKSLDAKKIHETYLQTLLDMGEFIPAWLYDVDFVESENLTRGYAEADPENNRIYYTPDASEHAIFHDLEHIRSRHNTLVKGYDEVFEKYVDFYFVGFRQSGYYGLFLEEGFNELSARKIFLHSLRFNDRKRIDALKEYEQNKYYNFEMYTCVALCALLGVKVDVLRNLKYTGDTTCQDYLQEKVTYLTKDKRFWEQMQNDLDGFQFAKHGFITRESCEEHKIENMKYYYTKAYELLFLALENRKITKEEFKRRLDLFESYTKKSFNHLPGAEAVIDIAKQIGVQIHRKTLIRNGLYTYVQSENKKVGTEEGSFVSLKLQDKIPLVLSQSLPRVFFERFVKQGHEDAKAKILGFEESKYGLS